MLRIRKNLFFIPKVESKMEKIVSVNDVVMEYDLNRGKVRSLKEKNV